MNRDVFAPLNVSYFPRVNISTPSGTRTIGEVLGEFKAGVYKDKIEYLRTLDEAQYKIQKANLPAVTFAGTFAPTRGNAHIESISNLICLDFDHVTDAAAFRDGLKIYPYVYASWISPSGRGVKCLIVISNAPNDVEFKIVFNQVKKVFPEIDEACKDIARLCFASHDPDLWVNPNVEFFKLTEEHFEEVNIPTTSYAKDLAGTGLTPWEDFNERGDHAGLLQSNGWSYLNTVDQNEHWTRPGKLAGISASWHINKKLFYVFSSSTHLESSKAYSLSALFAFLEHGGNFNTAGSTLYSLGYGERSTSRKPNTKTSSISQPEGEESFLQYSGFWGNNRTTTNIVLSTGKVYNHLVNEFGFCIFEGQYLQIKDGVIYEREREWLYNLIVDLVSDCPAEFEIQQGKKSFAITFDIDQLRTLAQKEIHSNVSMFALPIFSGELYKDTATEIYLHFRNTTLRISPIGIKAIERDNRRLVWEKHIIQHSFVFGSDIRPMYEDFIRNISGKNFDCFRSVIGYTLRNYNGSDGLRAIWLTDENYDAGKSNGRAGKSLFWKALAKLRNATMVSGKDFKPDGQFKYQNVSRATQIFSIDDVKEKFDFKGLYNICSEGMEFQKKFGPLVQIPLSETPKVLITSNAPPKIEEGASTVARMVVLPVSNFYTRYANEGGVKHFHKCTFFDDWSESEWSAFYLFMAKCGEYYLSEGLKVPDLAPIRLSRLKGIAASKFKSDEVAEDFCNWIESYSLPSEFNLLDVMREYNESFEDQQVFSSVLKDYLDLNNLGYTKKRERVNGTQKTIWRVKK